MSLKPVPIYQIKITLKRSQPPIWRRIQVRSDTTLHKLHQIIQIVMPWEEDHAHQFTIGGVFYDVPSADYFGLIETEDERKFHLNQLITGRGFKFEYEYDFGDGWEHILLVENILPFQEGVSYPVCLEGKRAGPPEDIGGISGYYHFLSIIKDPKHPEYQERREWVAKDFDPEVFNLKEANQELRKLR